MRLMPPNLKKQFLARFESGELIAKMDRNGTTMNFFGKGQLPVLVASLDILTEILWYNNIFHHFKASELPSKYELDGQPMLFNECKL